MLNVDLLGKRVHGCSGGRHEKGSGDSRECKEADNYCADPLNGRC